MIGFFTFDLNVFGIQIFGFGPNYRKNEKFKWETSILRLLLPAFHHMKVNGSMQSDCFSSRFRRFKFSDLADV